MDADPQLRWFQLIFTHQRHSWLKPDHPQSSLPQGWLLHLNLPEFDITRFLSSESMMLAWKTEGMPADQLSMQNGVVILESKRSPLMIDPSAQVSPGGC